VRWQGGRSGRAIQRGDGSQCVSGPAGADLRPAADEHAGVVAAGVGIQPQVARRVDAQKVGPTVAGYITQHAAGRKAKLLTGGLHHESEPLRRYPGRNAGAHEDRIATSGTRRRRARQHAIGAVERHPCRQRAGLGERRRGDARGGHGEAPRRTGIEGHLVRGRDTRHLVNVESERQREVWGDAVAGDDHDRVNAFGASRRRSRQKSVRVHRDSGGSGPFSVKVGNGSSLVVNCAE
jgi:hypothetical protein